jgi:hypothetical protein
MPKSIAIPKIKFEEPFRKKLTLSDIDSPLENFLSLE